MSVALSGTRVRGTHSACTAQLLSCTTAPRVDPGLKDIPELSPNGTSKALSLTVGSASRFFEKRAVGYERGDKHLSCHLCA